MKARRLALEIKGFYTFFISNKTIIYPFYILHTNLEERNLIQTPVIMKFFLLIIPTLFIFLMGCRPIKYNSPSCVNEKIEAFKKDCCENGANVKEYTFQGEKVFVFDPGTCGADMTSEVINQECKHLGYLGGFIGNMKINNENFSNAIFIRTTWEN